MVGTDVELSGVADEDVEAAKDLFRHYAGDEVLEETEYGVVLARPSGLPGSTSTACVSPRSATTSSATTHQPDKGAPGCAEPGALERGPSALYGPGEVDRPGGDVRGGSRAPRRDLSKFETGRWHDEVQLVAVGVHACQVLNASGKVIFLTPQELNAARDFVDRAKDDG